MLQLKAHYCLTYIALYQVYFSVESSIIDEDHILLAEISAYFARQHLSRISTTLVVVEGSINLRMRTLNVDLLEKFLLNIKDTMAVQVHYGRSEYQLWEYQVIFVDSAEAFKKIRWSFAKEHDEIPYRFLVILTQYTRNYANDLSQIFTFCYRNNILNVNILLRDPQLGICMFMYKLFTDKDCRLVQPILYWQLKDGLDSLEKVFPRKLINFHGCPFRVSGRLIPPFLTYLGNTNEPKQNGDWDNLKGIDGILIRKIAHVLNFTIDLLPFRSETIDLGNYSLNGCFAELQKGRADIAIGGFSASHHKRDYFSGSSQYHSSPYVFVVRSGCELSSMYRLLRPFTLPVWLSLFAFLLVAVLIIIYIFRVLAESYKLFLLGQGNRVPVLNFFAVFLGYPMTLEPRRNFARFILMIWLMMSLVLRSAYQGSLYDSFRLNRFMRIPPSYDELLKLNYVFILSEELHESGLFPKNRTLVLGGGHQARFELLESIEGRFATVALRDYFVFYLETKYREGSKLKMVKEPLYLRRTAMFFPKHSMYREAINKVLMHFHFAGITRLIAKKSATKVEAFKDRTTSQSVTYNHLKGLYQIYGVMLVIVFVVFLLEILSVYSLKLRITIEWLNSDS